MSDQFDGHDPELEDPFEDSKHHELQVQDPITWDKQWEANTYPILIIEHHSVSFNQVDTESTSASGEQEQPRSVRAVSTIVETVHLRTTLVRRFGTVDATSFPTFLIIRPIL